VRSDAPLPPRISREFASAWQSSGFPLHCWPRRVLILPVAAYLSPDESLARLHRAGWSVGDVRLLTAEGAVWWVSGTNGENALSARGRTQAKAWHHACLQARALGMLRE
jgi:hypothetical protein